MIHRKHKYMLSVAKLLIHQHVLSIVPKDEKVLSDRYLFEIGKTFFINAHDGQKRHHELSTDFLKNV